jgi:RNA polymerase sigma-70 factor (ECF subfamily)
MALRFEELIERHHDEIFTYLWRLLGKERRGDRAMDVEDLVQEVFLRAYRSFTAVRPNSNYRAWFYKIATNCAYTRLRQIKTENDGFFALNGAAAEIDASNDGATYRDGVQQRVRLLVNGLPPKQKVCLTLRYLQDLDYTEIARIVGCSPDRARANVSQAIRRLRQELAEDT